jgi:hypothetical protein
LGRDWPVPERSFVLRTGIWISVIPSAFLLGRDCHSFLEKFAEQLDPGDNVVKLSVTLAVGHSDHSYDHSAGSVRFLPASQTCTKQMKHIF